MKKLSLGIFAIVLVLVAIFQTGCKKDNSTTTTEMTKDEILVAKVWKFDKVHHVISGRYSIYAAGGINTTGVNYDKLRFKFNADGTGTHVDQFGVAYSFVWKFLSSDKRMLELTTKGRTDVWDMVEISDKYLHGSSNIILNGDVHNVETFRLIQTESPIN